MKVPLQLYDDVGRVYPRKNLYLRDLAAAQADGDKAAARQIRAGRATHPHTLQLEAYEKEKKAFFAVLPKVLEAEWEKAEAFDDPVLQRLEKSLIRQRELAKFYTPYVDLSYEAEYEAKKATLMINRLPVMIDKRKKLLAELRQAKAEAERIDPTDQTAAQTAFNTRKEEIRRLTVKKNQDLRSLAKQGQISKKAVKQGIVSNNKEANVLIQAEKMKLPSEYSKDLIANLKHQLTQGFKDQEMLLQDELSDIARTTPTEVEPGPPWKYLVTAPIPGLGQLLNGQPIKALWFFLGALFTFLVAIPYALGYGNYRGDGIAGLITLAEGGKRLDRSIIFMIEGIIAIFLILFALVIYLLSIRDVYKVERDQKRGIRPKNRFEVKRTSATKGFPYKVSVPALILITFIVLVPIVTALLLSFTNNDPQHQSKFTWVGLQNYATIFTGHGMVGSVFWRILGWTVIWTITATTLTILVGFMLALLVNNDRVKGKRFFRTIYILPWAVPAFITIMFFSIMAAPGGFFSQFLTPLFGTTVNIKHDPALTRIALILIQTWCGSAYVFLLTTGVLQAIPSDLYEAAKIDGANARQRLTAITLPLVLFQTGPLLINQYTFNFNNYTIIRLFNDGGPPQPTTYGNLAGTSDLLISYIFKLTMENQHQALGAAIAILISLGLMIVAFIGYRRTAAFREN
ncbi:MAG TPA: ABC transporter permease subunit [Fastidiosipila sp.]|nr:ABC transporter permease subunit [Fastidiosipila sp.]